MCLKRQLIGLIFTREIFDALQAAWVLAHRGGKRKMRKNDAKKAKKLKRKINASKPPETLSNVRLYKHLKYHAPS